MRRRTESFIVASKSQTTLPNPLPLYNLTTLVPNINIGQIGVLNVAPNTTTFNQFIDTTPTAAEAPLIQFVERRDGDFLHPLSKRVMIYSGIINPFLIENVILKNFSLALHDVWQLGTPTSPIAAASNQTYQLVTSFYGRDVEYFNSCEQAYATTSTVKTPDFVALGTPNPTDYLIKHLVFDINVGSSAFLMGRGSHPVVAFAVTDGSSGGVDIATLTPNTAVPVFVKGSSTHSVTLSEEMVESLKQASTAGGFTRLLLTDLATAGNSTPNAKGILLLALDRVEVIDDEVLSTKNYLRVGIPYGFNQTMFSKKVIKGTEGAGYGSKLIKEYKRTQGQRLYFGKHDLWPRTEYPSSIVSTERYSIFTISHYRVSNFGHSSTTHQPMREHILIPHLDNSQNANPLISTLNTRLNNYLGSAAKPPVLIL